MIDKEIYMLKLHMEILTILDAVVSLCEKYNLKYYLIGGTLLGAVRHSGFIPWDDDLDICMPRQDFEKFIQIATSELPADFELLWSTTEAQYWLPFAKVANKRTLFEEESNYRAGRPYGIFVDIFPIDSSRGYCKNLQMRSDLVRKIKVVMFQKSGARNIRGVKKLASIIPWKVIRLFLSALMIGTQKDSEGMYYSSFCSQYNIKKQTMPKRWYGNGVQIQFEDRIYCAPVRYKDVLTSIFGENYMEIPPVEKRRMHYPRKVIFSDGEIIEFDSYENKVQVE